MITSIDLASTIIVQSILVFFVEILDIGEGGWVGS